MYKLINSILITFILVVNLAGSYQKTSVFNQFSTSNNVLSTRFTFEFNKAITGVVDTRYLSVAFHSFYFIDSYGNQVGSEIVLNSSLSQSVLTGDWFIVENDATIGAYRWSGGNSRSASIDLQVPVGAEGLIVKIKSIEDALQMSVRMDGVPKDTLLVDTYWHSGYIPINQTTKEPLRTSTPAWIEGYSFPQFPKSDSLYIIKVHLSYGNSQWYTAMESNWRVSNYNDMTALTLVGMQGIINRYGARVYLEWDEPYKISASWIPVIQENIKTKYFDFDGLSAIKFLYRRFESYFSGIVIYDPEVSETINLATMIAGLNNYIMIAPNELSLPGIPRLTVSYDLRNLVQQNNWGPNIDDQYKIYDWVYKNLWKDLDHRIIGIISPGPPTSRTLDPTSTQYWPLEMLSRDYFIALKLPCIYLHPKEDPQMTLFK